MPTMLVNRGLQDVLQAVPRHYWAVLLLVATGCGRTSHNLSATGGGVMSTGGTAGRGAGGNTGGKEGTGGSGVAVRRGGVGGVGGIIVISLAVAAEAFGSAAEVLAPSTARQETPATVTTILLQVHGR
jgi:hypothetical protein